MKITKPKKEIKSQLLKMSKLSRRKRTQFFVLILDHFIVLLLVGEKKYFFYLDKGLVCFMMKKRELLFRSKNCGQRRYHKKAPKGQKKTTSNFGLAESPKTPFNLITPNKRVPKHR